MKHRQIILKKLLLLIGVVCAIFLAACIDGENIPVATESAVVSTASPSSHLITPTAPSLTPLPDPTLPPSTVTASPTFVPSTHTPVPSPTTVPLYAHDPMILFARNDDLWWAALNGDAIEPLTEGELLNWGMMGERGDWELSARSLMPHVSANGRFLAFSTRSKPGLHIIDLAAAIQTQLPDVNSSLFAWSPDSQYLAYATTSLQLYNVETGEVQNLVPFKPGELGLIKSLLWSSDGQSIVFSCCFFQSDPETGAQLGEVLRVDVATGELETITEIRLTIGGGLELICWTADGNVTIGTGLKQSGLHSCSGIQFSTVFSADGTLLAGLGPADPDDQYWQGPSLLTIEDMVSGELLLAHEVDVGIRRKVWSPDSQFLYLDDLLPDSPIWRISIDGEELKVVVENGYLLDLIPAWHNGNADTKP